jgi:hypothetical protein
MHPTSIVIIITNTPHPLIGSNAILVWVQCHIFFFANSGSSKFSGDTKDPNVDE